MIAEKPQLVSREVTANVLIGKADIPLTLQGFNELSLRKCILQTAVRDFPENTFFIIHEYRGESTPYVVNYNNSGKLVTYDRLSDQDKDSILTVYP